MRMLQTIIQSILAVSILAVSILAVVLLQVTPSHADCPPLPLTGNPVNVSTSTELESAVNNASPGDTILVADGNYQLDGIYLRIDVPNVTLRSASGDRNAVILDGNYITTEIIQIVASNVTVADITLREAYYHPIHVTPGASSDTLDTLIYNVQIIDPGEQAIKINTSGGGFYTDRGTIACSRIELTDAGRPFVRNNCYTGGVDAHQSRDWIIRDNYIEGFWCDSGLSEHAIHLWRGCRDTLVERNVMVDNARGVGFGLADSGTARTYPDNPCPGANGGYVDHYGGIIRNNFIFATDPALFASQDGFDCGICLWQACGAWALHNTVASTSAPFSSIEWRFDNADVDIFNNLVTHNIRDRGGVFRQGGNLENQPLSMFVDGPGGDLHLAASATAAIDQAVAIPAGMCDDDLDEDARPVCAEGDIGADELAAAQALTGNTLLMFRNGNDVEHRWPDAQGASTYNLYRTTDRTYATANMIQSGLPSGQATDSGVVPPPPANPAEYYYRVTAIGACGEEPL